MQEKFGVNEFSRENQCRVLYLSYLEEVVRLCGFHNFRQNYGIYLEYSLESILKCGGFIFKFFVCYKRSVKYAAPVGLTLHHNIHDKGLLPRHRVSEAGYLH